MSAERSWPGLESCSTRMPRHRLTISGTAHAERTDQPGYPSHRLVDARRCGHSLADDARLVGSAGRGVASGTTKSRHLWLGSTVVVSPRQQRTVGRRRLFAEVDLHHLHAAAMAAKLV